MAGKEFVHLVVMVIEFHTFLLTSCEMLPLLSEVASSLRRVKLTANLPSSCRNRLVTGEPSVLSGPRGLFP